MLVPPMWDRHAPLPSDLASAYLAAMDALTARFGPTWRERDEGPRPWRRHVRYMREAGWRNEDIAFAVEALRAEDPAAKTSRIYGLSPEEARRSLCAIDDAPAGWLDRTRLDKPDGELAFRAAHTLAWWSSIAVDEIVRSA